MNYCCLNQNQSFLQTLLNKTLESLPIIILTAALVVATVYLAKYTYRLWKTTQQYTDETKKANEINENSNKISEQANNINLLSNLYKLKTDVESIFIMQVKASFIKCIEDVLPILTADMNDEQRKQIIDKSEMLKFIDPLLEKLKPAYDELKKNIIQCISAQDHIDLEVIYEYTFNESLLIKSELSSKIGDIAGKFAAKKIFLLHQKAVHKDLLVKSNDKLKEEYSLELVKIILDLNKELDNFKIEEILLKSEGIKEINNFFV